MAGVKAASTPRTSQLLPVRRPSTMFNRCISSNITMVHTDDGKPAVIAKQSTFSVPSLNGPYGVLNITRVEERCSDAEVDDDVMSTVSGSSYTSSSCTSISPSPSVPVLRVKSSYAKTSHDALRLALRQLEWQEKAKQDGAYDFYWHGVTYEDTCHDSVTEVHAVNKLPGMLEISHKVQLSRILKRMQTLYPGEFDFYPTSWVIPEQYHQFIGEVGTAAGSKNKNGRFTPDNKVRKSSIPTTPRTFIVKPDAGRQGDGIYLVTDPRDVQAEVGTRPSIVQEYIDSPLLLEGYKFDLRIYVVISRIDPVEIYICKEGLARLCTTPYEAPTKQNVKNTFMHLTNYSLNKNSEDFVQTDAAGTGSKRTLTSVEELLEKKGYDVKRMRKEIKQLAVKTILAILPDLAIWSHASNITKNTRCFQILGFDVMLTSELKAYLLEVNAAPSLRIDAVHEVEPDSGVFETVISAVDEQVKVTLIRDTLELVALGEENIDMTTSCLKRIYPVKNPNEPPKNFQEFQERIRLCDKRCREHNTHGGSRTSASLLSHQISDLKTREGTSRARNHWFCNRHCLHCHATITRKKSNSVPSVIKYRQAGDNPLSSDWRFFDHHSCGSTLLKYERQPVVNNFKHKPAKQNRFETGGTDLVSSDEDEPYKQCYNCGGYLNEAVGPGIIEQRDLLHCKENLPEVVAQSYSFTQLGTILDRDKNNPLLHREFKLTPAHTSLVLPRYDTKERDNYGQKAWATDSNKDLLADDKKSKHQCQDIQEKIIPSIPGKRGVVDRNAKSSTFSGYHMLLLRRCAKIFIYFNGIKSSLAMGATAFRNMARKCNLCDQGSLPSIDILYIDSLRQWQSYRNAHGTPYYIQTSDQQKDLKSKKAYLKQATGLPFQGFVDAIFRIASQRYRGETLRDKVECLIAGCERYIASAKKIEKAEKLKQRERGGTLMSPWKDPVEKNNPRPRIKPINIGSYPKLTRRSRRISQ
uniref:uncharacterized protein LOC120334135 n=1 Tax=Styela clava TaxID=7725 RepID=UPI00193A6FA4|nr:uncharacterized protein LOC120334135 [Styela clava]XP_039257521.1 uncharacterized protein LOC120334135 [Styela clava]